MGVCGWADIRSLPSYYKYLHNHSHTVLKQAAGLLHSLGRSSHFVVPTPPEALIKSLACTSRPEMHSLLRHPILTRTRGSAWGSGLDARPGNEKARIKAARRVR